MRQVGSRKGTVGRIAEQPVFMGCLLSFTVPGLIFLLHISEDATHTRISLNECNLNSHAYIDVN